jgi:hypothetical protein
VQESYQNQVLRILGDGSAPGALRGKNGTSVRETLLVRLTVRAVARPKPLGAEVFGEERGAAPVRIGEATFTSTSQTYWRTLDTVPHPFPCVAPCAHALNGVPPPEDRTRAEPL